MNNNKEWIFIINPVAGKGFANSLEGKIREMIQKHNIQAEIVFTEKEGHATQLSQKYLEKKARYFIGVGGDGTLNEIAVPLVYKPGVILGAIPGGTCNDFLQITGFPDNFTDKDWEIFFRGNSMPMDVGTCNGVIFLNGLGLGFDAHIAFENFKSPGKTKLSAKQKYITHILKNLLFYKEKKMIVRTTYDTIETDCFINTIGNGRRFAGGFNLTPQAIADDGLLDVCSIKSLSLLHRIYLLMLVPDGLHIKDKKVNYYRTEKISLEFPDEVPFHVDGELHSAKKFEVGIMRKALKVIYNPEGKHFFGRQGFVDRG